MDFAYHVHTDVGNRMKGAKVNGKLVPNNHELQNAEVVEIVTYGTEITAQDVLRHMVCAVEHSCIHVAAADRAKNTLQAAACLFKSAWQLNLHTTSKRTQHTAFALLVSEPSKLARRQCLCACRFW